MNPTRAILELGDLDALHALGNDADAREKLARHGFTLPDETAFQRERQKLTALADRRWLGVYERSLGRYGAGVTLVRERVCQGCFVTLPTSAAPPPGEAGLHLCVGCGRLLYWH